MSETRELPPPLTNVRDLPFGEYIVRVVHLEKRDMARGGGRTLEAAQRAAERVTNSTPHVVLHLEEHFRSYVLDDAQSFRIGSIIGPAPEMFERYKLTIRPHVSSDEGALTEDYVHSAAAVYEKLSG